MNSWHRHGMTISLFSSFSVFSWLRSRRSGSRAMPDASAHQSLFEPVTQDVAQDDEVAAAPTLLAEIDFSETGNARRFLLDGWSHQEPHFIWALDETSTLRLPDLSGCSDVALELDVFPCILPPNRTIQRLRLQAGEDDVGSVEMTESGCVTIATPPTLDWSTLRRLTLIHPDGIVPCELPGLADGRCLSIALRRLTFRGRCTNALPAPQPDRGEDSPGENLSDRELILSFEGLGGTFQGCEFGLVQRELGVEPVSLLRWTYIDADQLAAALEADFAGVGTPEQTILDYFEWPTGREYRTQDRQFFMGMHTWVKEAEKPYDTMFKDSCRRLVFLRDKLLDDLADASKIFVYKTGDQVCTGDQIARIHRALRRHAPNTLFYVRFADDTHPSGTVEPAGDGLLIGYISQFNETVEGEVRKPDYVAWRSLCREAYRLWRISSEGKKALLF